MACRGRRGARGRGSLDVPARRERDEGDQVAVVACTPPGPRRPTMWRASARRASRRHASSSAGLVRSSRRRSRVDACQVLEDRASGAEVQVPDLGVAHLAGRQADRLPPRDERRVRPLAQERSPGRHRGGRDRVGRRIVTDPNPSRTTSTIGRGRVVVRAVSPAAPYAPGLTPRCVGPRPSGRPGPRSRPSRRA